MDVWKQYEGKNVFVILKNKRKYSGIVLEVETDRNSSVVWIVMKDKKEHIITFCNSEIEVIQEEEKG